MGKVPLENALVEILKNSNLIASKPTDASGKALFYLPEDIYKLRVSKEGYSTYESDLVLTNDRIVEVILSKKIPTVSGIDPNDPRIVPEGGWDVIYNFENTNELSEACSETYSYTYIEGGLLKFNPPEGDCGVCTNKITNKILVKFAMAFKVKVFEIEEECDVALVVNGLGTEEILISCGVDIMTSSDTSKLQLYVLGSGIYEFTNPNDWLLLYVDFDNLHTTIYDKNWNELISENLVTLTENPEFGYYGVEECSKNSGCGVFDVEVDWIALKHHQIG